MEMRADRLASKQPQVTRTCRKTEQLIEMRRAKPLKLDRQREFVEVTSDWRRWKLMRTERRVRHRLRGAFTVERAKPSVLPPYHSLNRCLAAERAAAAIVEG